jgi:DNA-binding NarL/FixJ family response regulator
MVKMPMKMAAVVCVLPSIFGESIVYILSEAGFDATALPNRALAQEAALSSSAALVVVDIDDPCWFVGDTARSHWPAPILGLSGDQHLLNHSSGPRSRGVVIVSKDADVAEVQRVACRLGQVGRPPASGEVDAFRPPRQRHGSSLTTREIDVLGTLFDGYSTDEIACALGVRPSTARTYVQRVLMKLGAHTRSAALCRARDLGIVPSMSTHHLTNAPRKEASCLPMLSETYVAAAG